MKAFIKIALSLVLIALAVVCYFKLMPASESRSEKAYFYDLEQKQLFVAPRNSIPPINGIKGAPLAGVRAIVISRTGNPADMKHREIAYLEKYSPELREKFETIQQEEAAGHASDVVIDRHMLPTMTLVRRLNDTEWHPLSSDEGAKITMEWNTPDPDGRVPVVCSP
jgi:hypothetical protein